MKRHSLGLAVALALAGCGTSVTPAAVPIEAETPEGARLVVDLRVFDPEGGEVPCTADLELFDTGREGGGAHEVDLTACHETLDGSARAYGSYRFEYSVPGGGPRYLQARSRSGRALAPPEFTVQVSASEGPTAWRSLSVAYLRD